MNTRNKFRETPLHKSIFNNSVRLLMVNLLLEAGADVNLLSTRGESCLHFAVHLGREDLVSVLIKAGADITIRGGAEGKSAYELAMQGSNASVTNILRQAQDIYDWLSSLGLEMYWKVFVREEVSIFLICGHFIIVAFPLVFSCSVLFCSVLFCSVLFCSVLFCSVLFCSVLFCSVSLLSL